MNDFLNQLLAHSEWANAVFFNTWGKSPARDNEEMRQRVSHIIGVQAGFISVFKDEVPVGPGGPTPTYDELKARAQKTHSELRNMVSNFKPEDVARTIRVPWFPDPPCVISRSDALVQVAMHTQHHRGQCMTRLKDFGGEPKNIDWIIWLWKQKPEAEWNH